MALSQQLEVRLLHKRRMVRLRRGRFMSFWLLEVAR